MFEPAGANSTIDDAMIAGEGHSHHVHRLVRTIWLSRRNNLLRCSSNGQDARLRIVDDGREVRYAEHPKIGDRDGAAHELVGQKFSVLRSPCHLFDIGRNFWETFPFSSLNNGGYED